MRRAMVRRRGVRRWHRAALLGQLLLLLLLLLATAVVQVVHHGLEAFALQNELQTTTIVLQTIKKRPPLI